MLEPQRIIAKTIAAAYGCKKAHAFDTADSILHALGEAGLAVGGTGEMIAPDVMAIILGNPTMWSQMIRTMARERAGLEKRLAGRARKPLNPDNIGVPHLMED